MIVFYYYYYYIDNSVNFIYSLFGLEVMIDLFTYKSIISKPDFQILVEYIRKLPQTVEDKTLIQNKIKSVDLKAKLCNHPLSYFNYSSTTFDYYIYENIYLIPNYDSSNCLFEIQPSIIYIYISSFIYRFTKRNNN